MNKVTFFTPIFALFLTLTGYAQPLYEFKDTANGFSIGMPAGWTYKVPTEPPTIKLMVWTPLDSTQKVRRNFNINVINEPNSNISLVSAKLLSQLAEAGDFKLIDSGSIINNQQRIIWFEETHKSHINNVPLFSTVFLIYDDGKAYIYTATASPSNVKECRPLFLNIGKTFKTRATIRNEYLKIAIPEAKAWQTVYEGNDSAVYTKQLIPANETIEHWKTMIHQTVMKNLILDSIHKAVEIFSAAARQETTLTKVTILQEENLPDEKWALFKAETPYFPNDPNPESQLWYLLQGKKSFHTTFIAQKEKSLSPDFINQWITIFRKSTLVNE